MKEKVQVAYFNHFILLGVIAGLVALLDFIGVITFPVGFFGVSSAFYIGAAFFTAFAIWFGLYGLLAIYIGLLIGAIIAGTFTIFAFVLALGNVFGAAIPMIVFKKGNLNIELKNTKDYIGYFISSTFGQSIVSGFWTIYGFSIFGIIPSETIGVALSGWVFGDIVVSLIIGIPLLKLVSPVIKRTSLYKKKFL